MPRKTYKDVDPPGNPNTILQDRIGPMRGYFNSLPGSYNVNDCSNIVEVMTKYPELFVDDTHRHAVAELWKAQGLWPEDPDEV